MIKENIIEVKRQISAISSGINRDIQQVTIVAVSKGRTIDEIKEAVAAGISDIGENKVQEALTKYNAIRQTQYAQLIKWHMVGHLQTNKVKDAVRIFDLIHSLDSLRVAEEINKQAAKINKIQDILIEVNISGEESKFGVKPEGTAGLIKEVSGLKNINIKGLMAIAPIADDVEKSRPFFRSLRELRDKISELRITNYGLRILSMGMSSDYRIAVEEGSTMVRIGRAVFAG